MSTISYRQQFTRCGKQRCRKCREGKGHGPYWYAYWSENGRTVSKYIGVWLPPSVDQEQSSTQQVSERTEPTPAKETPILRAYTFGTFRLERQDESGWHVVNSDGWQQRSVRALLGCLLSSPGRRLSRERAMTLLWPDFDGERASDRLNVAVHELRHVLDPDRERAATSLLLRIERETDTLELAGSSHLWVDADGFEHLLSEAEATSEADRSEQLLEEAARLYQGEYLGEELYAEWAMSRRQHLQRKRSELLLTLSLIRAERGALSLAIDPLDQLLLVDPTNETALQRLMILLARQHRRSEALNTYREYVKWLKRNGEDDPEPATRNLYEKLQRGQLPTDYGARSGKTFTSPRTKKEARPEPSHMYPQGGGFTRPVFQARRGGYQLVGRVRERAALQQVLLAVERRAAGTELADESEALHMFFPEAGTHKPHLVLLTGEAGIGKTRLAEELALEAYERGWAVAWNGASEQESTIPYRAWEGLLQEVLPGIGYAGQPVIADVPGTRRAQTLRCAPGETGFHKGPRPNGIQALFLNNLPVQAWEETMQLLSALSGACPLLLVLDDLNYADEESTALLLSLSQRLQEQRILILSTCREDELASTHRLRPLIAHLRQRQALLPLAVPPLTEEEIAILVAEVPQEYRRDIQKCVAGNPFFAETLAHSSLSAIGDQLPEAINTVFARRLRGLSRECRSLLGTAAALGASFTIRQLLDEVSDRSQEQSMLDTLEEALHAGLLAEEGTRSGATLRFYHPLLVTYLTSRQDT